MVENVVERMIREQEDSVKTKKVESIFSNMVLRINQEIDIPKFKNTYFPNEDRTLEFNIEGMESLDTGFVFKDGKVRTIRKLEDTPTVVFACTEDVFLMLAFEELSFASAWLNGWLEIAGENYLRDYEIFKRMFNKYGHIMRG